MNNFILISILFLSLEAIAQDDCKVITVTRNENFKEGTAYGNNIRCNRTHVILLEKIINKEDTINFPYYVISLVAEGIPPLTENEISKTGEMRIQFDDQTKDIWSGVKCSNVPTLPMWNFELKLTQNQFLMLTKKKLEKISTFDLDEITLSEKAQNKLMKIAICLISK